MGSEPLDFDELYGKSNVCLACHKRAKTVKFVDHRIEATARAYPKLTLQF